MKAILVTGGSGFIGSNFIEEIIYRYKNHKIINLDNLTYAGSNSNIKKEIQNSSRYIFIKGDICDKELVSSIFNENDIDYVFNFAAESHVDNSIIDPSIFIKTNALGVDNLAYAALNSWKENPQDKKCKKFKKGVKFIQISTDEVYGSLGKEGKFSEKTPLNPNSPYSASKASGDLIIRSYYKTFGLPMNITRCSNNYGPNQHPEKLIPLMIETINNNSKIPLYGDGMQIRDWLYVTDHCKAIVEVLEQGKVGNVYNIGGNNEKTNIEVAKILIKHFDKDESYIKHVEDRLGHDTRYAIDNSKITNELLWQPEITFEVGISKTIEWYTQNMEWMQNTKRKNVSVQR